MNILIVEDEKLTQSALCHCIEELRHTAFIAGSGEDAIRVVTTHKIDFVISDIMMPGISGLSLVSLLRNIYMLEVPIVLISSLDNDHMRHSSATLGATDFIGKPFTMADIAEKINIHSRINS